MTSPHDRFAYSAMRDRPRWRLPKGARVAVYCVLNVEEWDIGKPVAREYLSSPAGVVTVPNVPNWSWHEYGMRVGVWRVVDALVRRRLAASVAINARVCEGPGEPVARALRDLGWEFMGHGYAQAALHAVSDQRAVIRCCFEVLQRYTGSAPRGWLGPGLHETLETPDLLAEAGFRYVFDWPLDEHPVEMRTTHGPIVAMPYSMETGDLPMMVVHQHQSDVWLKRLKDQFDRLYMEGARQPRAMSISVHPFVIGVPHRIRYFEAFFDYVRKKKGVWLTTAGDLYDWYLQERGS
jgi:peptidoglycan/xylan/chitin deacetylase (PgdA/CDA1 family)